MRHSILLMMFDNQLKYRLIKMLIMNNLYFYEAVDTNEAIIKQIYLGSKLNLVIFQYVAEKETELLMMINEVRERDKDIRFLIILPEYKIKWLDWATSNKINDILVLPLDDQEVIRKIISLTPKVDGTLLKAQAGNYEMVREEIRRSRLGGYPLSFLLIHIFDLSDIESNEFEQKLSVVCKATDSLLFWEGNMFMMLFPFCKKQDLEVVKKKVLQAYDESARQLHTVREILVYGVTFPDDGNNFDEILRNLEDGMDSLKTPSLKAEGHNAYSTQQIISLINKLVRLEKN